jgi:hypothetical protein
MNSHRPTSSTSPNSTPLTRLHTNGQTRQPERTRMMEPLRLTVGNQNGSRLLVGSGLQAVDLMLKIESSDG